MVHDELHVLMAVLSLSKAYLSAEGGAPGVGADVCEDSAELRSVHLCLHHLGQMHCHHLERVWRRERHQAKGQSVCV